MSVDNKSFILYASTERQIGMLTDEEAGRLIKAVFAYNRSGEIPDLEPLPMMVFSMIQDYMDENSEKWEQAKEKRVAAGRAGGLARSSNAKQSQAMPSNAKQSQANQAVSVSVPVSVSESESESVYGSVGNSVTQEAPTPAPSPSPVKTPRGKFGHVLLADRELERLQELRPNDWEAKLQRLDDYIEQTGRSYNNHLLTIMSWAEEDDKKAPRPADTSVHFAQEAKNKGKYDGIFMDLFSEEAEEYIKGGNT